MAPRCSGHKWMPAAGPGLQPGPRACACGVAPTSSLALRGPQGEWGLWQPEDPLSHSRALGKKRMTGALTVTVSLAVLPRHASNLEVAMDV